MSSRKVQRENRRGRDYQKEKLPLNTWGVKKEGSGKKELTLPGTSLSKARKLEEENR